MPEIKKENFANAGTESFNLNQELSDAKKETVTLTIQDDDEGVVLDKGQSGVKTTGTIGGFYQKINSYLVSKSGVKIKEKADLFHLLAVMINAGIPMVKALRSLVSQLEKNPRMQMIVESLAESIEKGGSLSVSMKAYPDIFNEAEMGMIESGEASGQLSGVLGNLAIDTEKAHMMRSKVKGAMMYPIVIFFLLIAVVAAMMIYVIPKLKDLFDSLGGDLPMITKVVIAMSDFVMGNGLYIVIAVVALVIFGTFFKKTSEGKFMFDKLKLKLPIFGPLLQKSYLSRFARSLSNLLDSSVTIVRTLEITANSIGNEVYKRRLLLAVEDIKQGIPLAENLTESDLFPPMLVNMIDVGEKTAQLDEITAKVAKFYEDEVDTAVASISKIIEPIILVVIGVTVGVVVAAIMLPIMKLANLSGAL